MLTKSKLTAKGKGAVKTAPAKKKRIILSPAVKLPPARMKLLKEAVLAASLEGPASAKVIKATEFIITGPSGTRGKKRYSSNAGSARLCRESGKPYGK